MKVAAGNDEATWLLLAALTAFLYMDIGAIASIII